MPRLLSLLLCSLILAATAIAAPAERTRPAAVAGSWYPGDPAQLRAYLDDLLQGDAPERKDSGPVRALISPHAGYMYSGAVAAAGYRLVRGQAFKRVLLLGPSHHGGFHGLSIADATHYETPLGPIPLDLEAVKRLRGSPLVTSDPDAHRDEHSLEMQLPLLQRALQPGWRLVPILVGRMQPGDYATAAQLLRPLLDDHTLVVVSSDFTHYGPRYGYLPFPDDGKTAARLDALDRGSLDHILHKDPQGFLDYKARTGTTICGYQPIALLLHLLPPDSTGQLVAHATSGELTGDYENSVSYLSIAFREPARPADPPKTTSADRLSPGDMRLLHRLASVAVETAARPGDKEAEERLQRLQEDLPPELKTPAGAFVTLRRPDGELRGCVGYIQPREPLYKAVAVNGISAARKDWRFPPLRPQELAGLNIEVSVLTPPKPIDSYKDFTPGEEGVILEKDGHSAVFLPEVAKEYGWTREQTLNHLAQKAGLPEDAWRQGASFETFRTQSFTAPYSAE